MRFVRYIQVSSSSFVISKGATRVIEGSGGRVMVDFEENVNLFAQPLNEKFTKHKQHLVA